jgi:multidrug resistance efflux pump
LKKTIKYTAIIVAAIAVIGIIAWVVLQPPAVECIALENNVLENTFSEMGEVIPLSESDLFTKAGGKISAVKVAEGSQVRQGELLFVFDGSEQKNEEAGILGEISVIDSQIKGQISELKTQKSSLESEKASLENQSLQALLKEKKQREDLGSIQALYEFGGASSQEVNDVRMALDLVVIDRELIATQLEYLTAQISLINSQIADLGAGQGSGIGNNGDQQLLAQKAALLDKLNLFRENQDELEVFAAADGIVRDLSIKEGQVIAPGAKLCSIYQPDQYRVDCYILVENREGVEIGDEVEITLQLQNEDKKFKGKIVRLAQEAVEKVSKVGLAEKRIKTEIAGEAGEWESLGPYFPVEICFITAQAKNCLIVPKTALFEDTDNLWKVWAIRDGKAVAVGIEKGIQTPSQVEIKGELAPGDIIIRNVNTSKVQEGKSIKAVI